MGENPALGTATPPGERATTQQPPRTGRPAAPVASPFPIRRANREKGEAASAPQGDAYRLFRMGTCISSGLISRTSSGTPQAKAGSFLILKWYMLCMA